jgi:beta-fructofuranosidase
MKPGLTPAFELGLNHVGSGSTIISVISEPLAFYSTSQNDSMKFWRARFNKNLTEWNHEGENPVLTLDHPGLPEFDTFWRDPFVFHSDGRTFMIVCADFLDKDYVPVPIFEAVNDDLTNWDYKGILFTWPKHKLRNLEVPEFRPLGNKWIFLASSDAPVDRTVYFIGEFDINNLKFNIEKDGILDYSGHYYAQETIPDEEGNLFVMAWIPGWDRPWLPDFRDGDLKNRSEIWNGCFALPRKLNLDSDGDLIQQPVEILRQLRTEHIYVGNKDLPVYGPEAAYDVLPIQGYQLEINLEMDLDAASFCGLNVLCDENGRGGLYIIWSGNVLNVDGVKAPVKEWKKGDPIQLQIFIDKQLVEVFVNGGRYCVSRMVKNQNIKGDHIALTRLGGHAKLNYLEAWKMKTFN